MGQSRSGRHRGGNESAMHRGVRKFYRYVLENFIGVEKTVIFECYNFDSDYV
jgi:hypothetical protein